MTNKTEGIIVTTDYVSYNNVYLYTYKNRITLTQWYVHV